MTYNEMHHADFNMIAILIASTAYLIIKILGSTGHFLLILIFRSDSDYFNTVLPLFHFSADAFHELIRAYIAILLTLITALYTAIWPARGAI